MFDPKKATPEQVQDLYMKYLGVVSFVGENAPRLIRVDKENGETIERIFDDAHELTGWPYKRTIDRFELVIKRRKPS